MKNFRGYSTFTTWEELGQEKTNGMEKEIPVSIKKIFFKSLEDQKRARFYFDRASFEWYQHIEKFMTVCLYPLYLINQGILSHLLCTLLEFEIK